MCGLTGFWHLNGSHPIKNLAETATKMAETILYRGPDSQGVWTDEEAKLAMAHRRLAVIDLSPAGYQPMLSGSGRLVISYNGEIYNSPDIKAACIRDRIAWRGHSDTEVILEACEAIGPQKAVPHFIGMFSFALWDRKDRSLWLVRDRLGIKPMYYGILNGILFFGSQIKTFCEHPGFQPSIDMEAVCAYTRFGYIPAPLSIWQGIRKLLPGSMVHIRADGSMEEHKYWDLSQVAERGQRSRLSSSPEEATDELERLLYDAIGRRMVADVPLGAFLSGGIDSSLVCALMQAQSSKPVKTFTIGFYEEDYNEAAYAKAVAKHLGTEHHELYVRPEEAQSVIPDIPCWYDEPFSDSSQIPTTLVSRLARRHVIVSLSGDGGDELFAGYPRYYDALKISQAIVHLPRSLCRGVASALHLLSPTRWNDLFRFLPSRFRPARTGHRLHKLAGTMQRSDPHDFYLSIISQWHDPEALVLGGKLPTLPPWDRARNLHIPNLVERLQYLDTLTYLPDDILVKADRASMSCSLELRVPLLDHRVVEYSWRLAPEIKMRNGIPKWPLKEILSRHIPRELIERRKMGFGVPIDHWLRHSLRDWAEELLSEKRLREAGIFNPDPIRDRWQQHLAGTSDWHYPLWTILMFQAWLDSIS